MIVQLIWHLLLMIGYTTSAVILAVFTVRYLRGLRRKDGYTVELGGQRFTQGPVGSRTDLGRATAVHLPGSGDGIAFRAHRRLCGLDGPPVSDCACGHSHLLHGFGFGECWPCALLAATSVDDARECREFRAPDVACCRGCAADAKARTEEESA